MTSPRVPAPAGAGFPFPAVVRRFLPWGPARPFGPLLALALPLALLALVPAAALLAMAASGVSGAFAGFGPSHWRALGETAALLAGVAALAGSIGLGGAWLVSLYALPCRRWLDIGLVLPLAFPTYLAAFVAVEALDFFGPVQSAWRAIIGAESIREYRFPEIRSLGGAILVMGLVLAPYIYLPCRIVFRHGGRNAIDAARLAGASGWGLFARIGWPIGRRAAAGGLLLALLEALNDIGATEHLGVASLSVVIRDLWFTRGDTAGAAQLALAPLALVFLAYALDRNGRREAEGGPARRASPPPRLIPMGKAAAVLAFIALVLPVLLGFALPALHLIVLAADHLRSGGATDEFLPALGRSLLVAGGATALVLAASTVLALAFRQRPDLAGLKRLAIIGYAVPGTVLVVALLPFFRTVDDGIEALGGTWFVTGSLTAVLIALTVRFLAVGAHPAAMALGRLPPNLDHVARVHGRAGWRLALRVHLPAMRPGLLWGGALVFVDAMKELPATLLLRPFNFETLATRTYSEASASRFGAASVEALAILAVSALAVLLLRPRDGD